MLFNTDCGVTASGFILLEAGDFDELGLTLIGKKHILRTWKELTSNSNCMLYCSAILRLYWHSPCVHVTHWAALPVVCTCVYFATFNNKLLCIHVIKHITYHTNRYTIS